jgi:peptidoglycan-associated lipoprotein
MKFRSAILALTVVILSSFAACKTAPKQEDSAPMTSPTIDENALGDSDSGKAMGLQTVHFPYDSFVLDGEAKGVLNANAQILKDKPGVKIQIEGHCDSRGGIQYNIALGEKRANGVKKFLEDKGVSGDRITTISYGKERLVDQGATEEAHAKNRRANFVITSR